MRDYKDLRKRFIALMMCGLITVTTATSDSWALAIDEGQVETEIAAQPEQDFSEEQVEIEEEPQGDSGSNPDISGDVPGVSDPLTDVPENEITADQGTEDPVVDEPIVEDDSAVEGDPAVEDVPEAEDILETEDENAAEDQQIDEGIHQEIIGEITWTYQSNGDGTHSKLGVDLAGNIIEETEAASCVFDENGICKKCGYEKPVIEEVIEEEELVLETVTKSKRFDGNVVVTVTCDIPEGGYITIDAVDTKEAEDIVNNNISGSFIAFRTFDINIYDKDGNIFQPESQGKTAKIVVKNVDEVSNVDDSEIEVYRIDNANNVTGLDSQVVGENIQFESEHFTLVTVGTVSPYENAYLDMFMEDLATTAQAGTSPAYTRVETVQFYVYGDEIGSGSFTVDSYINCDEDNPTAGTKVATANVSYEVTSDDIGTWIPITATLSAVNSQDRYVYAGG
ncbi:MAG: hypothetical protein K5773_01240, partial [Pseudobutyrivibrio sp.]|nr:hypothetical protein [Pseudobutyrivibrio sp.]